MDRPAKNDFLDRALELDRRLLVLMRTRGHSPNLDTIMQWLGSAGEHGRIWAFIGAFGVLFSTYRKRQWAIATLIGPLAIVLNYAVKLLVGRPRPVIDGYPPLGGAPSSLSFPSAHATSSAAAAIVLGRLAPEARPYLYTLAAVICLSRPYLGLHYPSDVAAGVLLGTLLGKSAGIANPEG